MKKLIFIFAAAISIVACKTGDKKANEVSSRDRVNAQTDSANFTTIEWLDSTYRDLGTIKEGEKVEVDFHFKNTGTHNLIIGDVSAQCGCTTPDWPKQAIAPGEKSVIKAVFNSANRAGEQHKDVYVHANTLPQTSMTLAFRVEVTN